MKSLKANIIFLVAVIIIVAGIVVYKNWQKQPNQDSANDQKLELIDVGMGDSQAPVTMIEYFSYYCGYCKRFHDETLSKIKEKYIDTGKVRLILRPFPPYDLGAADLCANDQNKFLEYHNYLFANIKNIKKPEDLIDFAKKLGLNDSEFKQCLDSEKYLAEAEKWYQQSDKDFTKVGVDPDKRGTPAFFINGDLLLGAQPFESFEEKIDAKLAE